MFLLLFNVFFGRLAFVPAEINSPEVDGSITVDVIFFAEFILFLYNFGIDARIYYFRETSTDRYLSSNEGINVCLLSSFHQK